MSRLSSLLREVDRLDSQLASDLAEEFEALRSRRSFGLNFERHVPEMVDLYGRPVRRGDKVRMIPLRDASGTSVDGSIWRVVTIKRTGGERIATLIRHGAGDGQIETIDLPVEDLVVVAEFRDPIYPGLVSTGKIENGGDKPFHTVINAENFHALQMLLYTHEGKIDAIYLDPPYNTRDRDWKYNNDYVDSDDAYKHSKWLAMMERRLKLAKRLLNPENAVLIVAIDENEGNRLHLLMEQLLPEAKITTVTVVMNPKGTPENGFSRVDEQLIFASFGSATPLPVLDPLHGDRPASSKSRVRWRGLTRTGANGTRSKSPGAFYPIFINSSDGTIHSAGEIPPPESDGSEVVPPAGTVAVWPTPRPDGTHGRWSVVKSTFDKLLEKGAVRTGDVDVDAGKFPLWYLTQQHLKSIDDGDIIVRGREPDGSLIVEYANSGSKRTSPRTVWSRTSHSASEHGSGLLNLLIPGRTFPNPKSVFAVEDALRLFVADKPDATVLDFFAGSGTTAHAVMRLNRQDGGRRQCISVTNNEISPDEELVLRRQGLRPNDSEWDALGICEYITKPRIIAATKGKTPEGELIKGDYKFTDEFPMAEGLEENAEFFRMTYEAPRAIAHHRSFAAVAPLLWLRAGSEGSRIEKPSDDFAVADTYAILFDTDYSGAFLSALEDVERMRIVFVVTDDDRAFQMVCADLPSEIESVRLYSSYLMNFEINTGRK